MSETPNPPPEKAGFSGQELAKTLGEAYPATQEREARQASELILQTPEQFRDDFVAAAFQAQREVKGVVLQLEVSPDTAPMYDAMVAAKQRGLDVKLNFDPMSTGHVMRYGEDGNVNEGNILRGHVIRHKGDKLVVRQAQADRADLLDQLRGLGIVEPPDERPKLRRSSHNHIKLFIVDDVAWLGTMNLRESDFKMSNFMVRVTDPETVGALREIFTASEQPGPTANKVYPVSDTTELLLDGGIKDQSIIFERAKTMIDGAAEGDEFTLIGQYVPIKMMYGELLAKFQEKMRRGVRGKFLLPPPTDLHPVAWASTRLQKTVDTRQQRTPNMTVTNLARKTHVKALLVQHADGSREALFGSHNLTSWTVGIGNKELAMWSKDPVIVDQLAQYIDSIESEPPER